MNTHTSSSTVKLNLPTGILYNAKKESLRIGISLQDFIRMLMATYFANAGSVRALSRDQTLYNRAQQEIHDRKFITIETDTQLRDYLHNLNT